jgi:SIR2-like domain
LKLVVLTGAGASVCLGYPTMEGFLKRLPQADAGAASAWGRAFLGERGRETDSRTPGTFDLELLLSRLDVACDLKRIAETTPAGSAIDFSLAAAMLLPSEPPIAFRNRLISVIKDVYGAEPAAAAEDKERQVHLRFFSRLRSSTDDPLEVFTTNYDPSMEHLTNLDPELRVARGFVLDARSGESIFSEHAFEGREPLRLYHIHGSFYWQQNGTRIINVPPRLAVGIGRVLLPGPRKAQDAIDEPFLTLYRRLSQKVSEADRIIAIGYNGRDEEVTHRLLLGAARKPDSRVIVVMPEDPSWGWITVKEILGDRFTHLPLTFEQLVDDADFWRLTES